MELGDTPPTPIIEAAGKALAVYQSSYCWDNKTKGTSVCADYASPNEMLKDKVKEKVKANTPITFNFDVKKPTDVSLTIYDNGSISQVKVTGNSFQTPPEEGIYYYSLSAVWLTDIEKRISEGSSVYTFAIEVIK
ncbi:hypothetical protein SAMN05428962_2773 [Paenibacillus sp. BC26]|nr:hypothetical protein SAMN05428962_2773 [Paenibacillus sp. BC26]